MRRSGLLGLLFLMLAAWAGAAPVRALAGPQTFVRVEL